MENFCHSNKITFFVFIIGTKRSLIALCRQPCHQIKRESGAKHGIKESHWNLRTELFVVAFWQMYNERARVPFDGAIPAPLTSLPASTIEMKDAPTNNFRQRAFVVL
jgi:hypothetical protein